MEEAQIKVFDVIESEQVNCQDLLCILFPPPQAARKLFFFLHPCLRGIGHLAFKGK